MSLMEIEHSPPVSSTAAEPLTGGGLAALEEACRTCSGSAQMATLLVERAAALTGGDGAALLLAPADSSHLEVIARTGTIRIMAGGRLSAEVAEAQAPVRDGSTLLSAPIFGGGEAVGVLMTERAAGFADAAAARAVLQEVGRHGTTLSYMRETESLRARLQASNAMVDVGKSLTTLLAIDDILAQVVYLAESLVQGHAATIALVTDEATHLVLRSSSGGLRYSEGTLVPLRGSLLGWAVQQNRSAVTESVASDPRSFDHAQMDGPGVVVPVCIAEEPIGAFMVTRLEGFPPFEDEDVHTLERLSAYVAIAIQNARLFDEQTRAATLLRAQAEELARSQAQLVTAEKMAALGRITAGIAHEINSPLGSILSSLRSARGLVDEYRSSVGDPEVSPDDHLGIADDLTGVLDLADTAAARLGQFVRSIKSQTRATDGASGVFDPAHEVDSTVVLMQHSLRARQISIFTDMERGLQLTGDPGQFAMVVQNLISNAADAYDERGGEVWVRLGSDDGQIYLSVEDRGCGIPEEIQSRIFDYLFTTKDVGKGTGLGLSMVHNIVTSHFGGTVEFDSAPGRGTRFSITLPTVSER